MSKLAQILEQSSGSRQVCVSVFFLFLSLYKTNRFHIVVGVFSNRSQRTLKCGRNISYTLSCGSCATSLFLPNFDVTGDLLLNRRTATWNLFVNCYIIKVYSQLFLRRTPLEPAIAVRLREMSVLQNVKQRELRKAGTNSRCPFYRGVRLIEVSVKRESTCIYVTLKVTNINQISLRLRRQPAIFVTQREIRIKKKSLQRPVHVFRIHTIRIGAADICYNLFICQVCKLKRNSYEQYLQHKGEAFK